MRRLIGPFLFVFLTIMFLLLLQFLILHIDKLVGKGIPFRIVIELILSNLAYMVVLAVPMAVLVSCLMVFGRFSELNEYVAAKAAGIQPFRLIAPVAVIGIVLSVILMWFSNEVLPDANFRARSLFIDIRMKKPGFDLEENTFYDGVKGYTFLVRRIDNEVDSLFDITLVQEETSDLDFSIYRAKRGYLKSEPDGQTLTLYMHEGGITRFYPEKYGQPKRVEEVGFKKYRISFDLSDLAFSRSNPNQRRTNDRTLSAGALQLMIDSLSVKRRREAQMFFDRHRLVKADSVLENKKVNRVQMFQPPAPSKNREILRFLRENPPPTIHTEVLAAGMAEDSYVQYDHLYRALRDANKLKREYESFGINMKWKMQREARYAVEWHKKWAIPVGCLIFVLIGAPLGLITRKGNLGTAAVISAITFTFYWIFLIQGEKLADRLIFTPAFGMWFGNAIMFGLGLFLMFWVQVEGRFFKK